MPSQQLNSVVWRLRKLLADEQHGQCTDQQLLQRFIATREEDAFATLVERHGPMVLGVCRSVLRHAQDAEDVCQATFLVLARRAMSIRKPASLAQWLHGVAYRLAMRARADRDRLHDRRENDRLPANPMDELTGRELGQILHEELARLPESYRLPLILCYLEGQTRDEAAAQLGWSAATLKGRVDRGRNLLRRRLSRRGLALALPLLVESLVEDAAAGVVPAMMAGQTVRAAVLFLAGGTGGGRFGRVVALAEGWQKAMLTLKLKVGMALVLMAGILGAGAALAVYQARKASPEATPPAARLEEPKPTKAAVEQGRMDGRGDLLPEGAVIRFGSARMRHGSAIWASAVSPDGKILATASHHSVMLWDLEREKPLRRFPFEDGGNTFCRPGLVFSPDGTRLGYVRNSFFACVWDVRSGKELRRFERCLEDGFPKLLETCCQFADEGREFVLCSRGAIETWNVQTGAQTAYVPGREARVLAPNGRTCLSVEGLRRVFLCDTRTGKELRRWEVTVRHNCVEDGLAFSPDGKTLAMIVERREIQLHKTSGGKVLASFRLPDSARWTLERDQYWQYRVTFSADGKTLLLGTHFGLIHRWDIASGKEFTPLSKHQGMLTGMHTLLDGRTFVSTGEEDGIIRHWDLRTGQNDVEPEDYQGRSAAAYSSDGRFAAVGDVRGRIDLWDGRSGKRLWTLQQEGTSIMHLAFAPDGKLLAAAQQSGTVQFWQVPSGRPAGVWRRKIARNDFFCNGLHFSPDGRMLCINDHPQQIRMLEVASGKLLWKGECSHAEAFSPDSARLVVAITGPYIAMLDATTGKEISRNKLNLSIQDGFPAMYTFAFSPDGHRLAVAADGGGLLLCDGRTGAQTLLLADGDPRARVLTMPARFKNDVRALAFSPDGKWFASAGSDTTIYIRESVTGQEVLRLAGHEAKISHLAFSPDGKRVFSFGQDGQGYLWDLKAKPAIGPRAALNELWADLAVTEASKAYRAVWSLSEDPRAVEFLRKRLPAVALPDKTRVAKLIADLDGESFEVREAASRALADFSELVGPVLEKAAMSASSAEQRRRLDRLITALKRGLLPGQLVPSRAVQAMQLAGTADARRILQQWARGAKAARLTQEAQAALERLDKHKR